MISKTARSRTRSRRVAAPLALVLLAGAALASCATVASSRLDELSEVYPNGELSPREVVEIQMEAFQLNTEDNDGIRIAFRFASPSNRRATGPLPRFTRLMMTPAYRPMLNAESVLIGNPQTRGGFSRVPVDLVRENGGTVSYYFYLRRQPLEECYGCWMTEGVELVPASQDQSV
jgi:hypothetical protein